MIKVVVGEGLDEMLLKTNHNFSCIFVSISFHPPQNSFMADSRGRVHIHVSTARLWNNWRNVLFWEIWHCAEKRWNEEEKIQWLPCMSITGSWVADIRIPACNNCTCCALENLTWNVGLNIKRHLDSIFSFWTNKRGGKKKQTQRKGNEMSTKTCFLPVTVILKVSFWPAASQVYSPASFFSTWLTTSRRSLPSDSTLNFLLEVISFPSLYHFTSLFSWPTSQLSVAFSVGAAFTSFCTFSLLIKASSASADWKTLGKI